MHEKHYSCSGDLKTHWIFFLLFYWLIVCSGITLSMCCPHTCSIFSGMHWMLYGVGTWFSYRDQKVCAAFHCPRAPGQNGHKTKAPNLWQLWYHGNKFDPHKRTIRFLVNEAEFKAFVDTEDTELSHLFRPYMFFHSHRSKLSAQACTHQHVNFAPKLLSRYRGGRF